MKVLIIGAGLAGLTLAYQLHKQEIDVTIVEARSRIGGRIHTVFPSKRPSVPLDYGSIWYWDEHKHIKKLIRELRLKHYPQITRGLAIHDNGPGRTPRQFTPQITSQKHRLIGGMQSLVDKLKDHLPPDAIHVDTVVTELSADSEGIVISATQNDKMMLYDADYVVNTLPPTLATTSIAYHPHLPEDVWQALYRTPTWMGYAMKVFLVYDSPFWQKMGLSGMSISETGVVNEFYDASPKDSIFGVLVGFINPDSDGYNMFADDRKQAVIEQLKRQYGWQAKEFKVFDEVNWAYESYTTDQPSIHNRMNDQSLFGNPILQEPVMNGRLFWGGSEISTVSGGTMDGAVYRANEIAEAILETVKTT